METIRLGSPLAAWQYVDETLARFPERRRLPVFEAAREGRRRRYSGLYLGYLGVPEDRGHKVDAVELPAIETPAGPEGDLARQIAGMLEPLRMLNPVDTTLGLGRGCGTVVPCFGIPLAPDLGDAPAYTITLEEALARPVPDPETSGLMPEMHARIDFIKSQLPAGAGIYLSTPDLQGPFNLAHAILGEDALIGPYVKPELYQEFMLRLTDLWVGVWRALWRWIGPEWLAPICRERVRIAECSVNLVSPAMYHESILPYDLRAATALAQPLWIHPCSGPHVFKATLAALPGVLDTEAGFVDRTAAGAISVEEALRLIGNRPIGLHIGQELPPGAEYEFICRDFDRCAEHPRLTFAYTGMHWRIRDRALIQEMHRRLDDYWSAHCAG